MTQAVAGLHIEPTNICTLKCPGCARTQFIDQWPQHWKNHYIDIDSLLRFLDIDLNNIKIEVCGNYGDPIYHPDFIDFVKKLKDQGSILTITTNGSYKKKHWWEELVDNLTDQDSIIFSIDGTPENFTEYRINADWQSIQEGLEVVAKSACDSSWKYIPFSFNENNIEAAEKLSKQIGIKNFLVDPSDRFDNNTLHLIPTNGLLGPRYNPQNYWKSNNRYLSMEPKCQDGNKHFITADGFYSPCCWIADHRFYYKTQFGKNKKQYDITKTTITEILEQETTVQFYQNLKQNPGCQYNCPKTAD